MRFRHSTAIVTCGSLCLVGIACSANKSGGDGSVGGAANIGGSSPSTLTGGTSSSSSTGGAAIQSGGSNSLIVGGTGSTGGSNAIAVGGKVSSGGSGISPSGGGKSSGGTSASAGGVASIGGNSNATGGAKNSGGSTSARTGGASSTGGMSIMGTGGAKNTGGASPVTTGGTSPATGGRPTTGGASSVPTGLPTTCGSTNCDAATPVNPRLTSYGALGNVTMYSTGPSNGGACIYQSTSIMYYAAINVNLAPGDGLGQWQGGRICGQCFEVTVVTTQGYKTVVVRVMDKCPDGSCGMDLGGAAPAAVMVDGIGRYQGAWRAVSCAGHPEVFDGVPSLHVKDGSNPGWSAIQIRNPMMGVAGIDYQDRSNGSIGGTMGLAPGIENYYLVPTDALAAFSTIDITIRYVDGSTATVSLTSSQLGTPDATYPLN